MGIRWYNGKGWKIHWKSVVIAAAFVAVALYFLLAR
jgi:hypothetical protein